MLVTRGHVGVAGRRAAQKMGTTTKTLQAWWKWLPEPQLSQWPRAGHVANSPHSLDLTPHALPIQSSY